MSEGQKDRTQVGGERKKKNREQKSNESHQLAVTHSAVTSFPYELLMHIKKCLVSEFQTTSSNWTFFHLLKVAFAFFKSEMLNTL